MTTETKFTVGEYTTRDGRDAIVCAVNKDGALIGAICNKSGEWSANEWFKGGEFFLNHRHDSDLMPPLREWWIVAGEAWDNEREAIDSTRLLQNAVKPIHVREVRDDQA